MPKYIHPRPPRKQGPYQVPSQPSHIAPSQSRHYWTIPTTAVTSSHMPLNTVSNLNLAVPTQLTSFNFNPPTPQSPKKEDLSQAPTGPWPASSDELLLSLRARALNWAEIQKNFFPSKSANACRKRYERIIAKQRGAHDWNEQRMVKLSRGYRELRERLWTPLAEYMGEGESWETVERKCLERGLKNLLTLARNHSPRSGTDDDESSSQENHDDSGVVLSDPGAEFRDNRKQAVGGMLAWDQILHR